MLLKQQLLRPFARNVSIKTFKATKFYVLNERVTPKDYNNVNKLIKKLDSDNLKIIVDGLKNKEIKTSPILINAIVKYLLKHKYYNYNVYYFSCIDDLFTIATNEKSLESFRKTTNYLTLDIITTNKELYNRQQINTKIYEYNKAIAKLYSIPKTNPELLYEFIKCYHDKHTYKQINKYLQENNIVFDKELFTNLINKYLQKNNIVLDKEMFTNIINKYQDSFANVTNFNELTQLLDKHKHKDIFKVVIVNVLDYAVLEYCFTLDKENITKLLYIVTSSYHCGWLAQKEPKLYDLLYHISGVSDIMSYENSVLWLDTIESAMKDNQHINFFYQ